MSKCQENRFPAVRSENMKRKITDFELMQLQERLKETEEVMERIVSRARAQSGHTPREGCVSVEQEEKLLQQLREITRVMQEGQLVDGIPSEMDTMESECDQFTGDSEEMLKHWSFHCCTVHHQDERETEKADRQMDNKEEMEQADRRKNEETERADRQMDEEETERADRQMDKEMDSDARGDEEVCTEMMKSEDQRWNTSLSGDHVIRQRSIRTTDGTESSH